MQAIAGTTGGIGDGIPGYPGISETGSARLPYLPALDGLRAVAVLAVLLYHADVPWMAGGYLGVEVFFVISGYLITALLLSEWRHTGRVNLANFWLHRTRRLAPALIVLLAAVVLFTAAFLPDEVAGLRGDVISAAGYVNNWYQVFSHKSYFETVGRPSLLRHLWSLAVEEQFYLVWPLALCLLIRFRGPRLALWVAGIGVLASSLWMAALYQPDSDPSRLYYGTDTRAAGLLAGSFLALARPPRVGGTASKTERWICTAAMGLLLLCLVRLSPYHPWLYRGGFLLVGLLTVVVIASVSRSDGTWICRLLAARALRWVGARSYGIYLWHFPVFMLTRPQLDVNMGSLPLLVVRLAITGLVAAASYRMVETPIRRGALGRSWRAWCEARGRAQLRMGLRWCAATAAVTLLLVIPCGFLANARPPAPPAYLSDKPAGEQRAPADDTASGWDLVIAALQSPAPSVAAPADPLPPTKDCTEAVTAIGDSVMQGVAAELEVALGTNLVIDADQGRLPWKVPDITRDLRAQGKINPTVILHIGNNGHFSARMFDRTMAELKNARRVVVMNVKVPRNWQDPNNAMLAELVGHYTNAVLVDWHSTGAARPELFWKDGLHLRPEGARVYAQLVAQAIKPEPPAAAPASGPADQPESAGSSIDNGLALVH